MFKMQRQASPTRSMNSGDSSSSMRSTINGNTQKISTNQSSTRAIAKTQSPVVSQKWEDSPQGSFDEVDDGPVPEGLAKCSICKRNFAEDRLEKHQTICQKTKSKKRKIYDASKKRVQVRRRKSNLKY